LVVVVGLRLKRSIIVEIIECKTTTTTTTGFWVLELERNNLSKRQKACFSVE
jgi:hypothetical protein